MNAATYKTGLGLSPQFNFGKANSIIQPKLTINSPGDKYEQEADAMASRVMRMEDNVSNFTPKTGIIGNSVQRKCAACEKEEKLKPLMRKESAGMGGMPVSNSFSSSLSTTKGGGATLPTNTRNFMENAFSSDFSNVKIHSDNKANALSQNINAKAFTHGSDIYFGAGQYSPNSYSGKSLLAHELTHVVQQESIRSNSFIQRAAFVCDEYTSIPQTNYNPGPGLFLTLNNHAINITANLEIYGEGATQLRAEQIKNTIERIWTNTFDSGYSISTTVNIQVQGSSASSSRTLIRVLNGAGTDSTRPHYWLVGSRIINYYVGSDINWVPAHELGHLLGLPDHYSESFISKAGGLFFNAERTNTVDIGWDGNLMAVNNGILERKNVEELIRIGFSPRYECAHGHLESPM